MKTLLIILGSLFLTFGSLSSSWARIGFNGSAAQFPVAATNRAPIGFRGDVNSQRRFFNGQPRNRLIGTPRGLVAPGQSQIGFQDPHDRSFQEPIGFDPI